tara:strand:- start:267 stop:419 length:153 start_codon:yes stop_codon:yes gene_type:complete
MNKTLSMKKEFKVEIIKEGALSTLLFGSSKLPLNVYRRLRTTCLWHRTKT